MFLREKKGLVLDIDWPITGTALGMYFILIVIKQPHNYKPQWDMASGS